MVRRLSLNFSSLSIINTCEAILKNSIYLLTFLLPLFVLPWSNDILDFNKQILLIGLTFIAFFCWLIKILAKGEISISWDRIHPLVFIFCLACLLSTIFSLDRYGSFWGFPRRTSESFFTLLGFILLYLLISNNFNKKETFKLLIVLGAADVIVSLIGVLQILRIYLPFPFAKTPLFNTVGLVGGLGLFCAVLLPVLIVLSIYTQKWLRVLFVSGIVLSTILFLLINYVFLWWVIGIESFLLILAGLLRKNLFDLRWLILPMFFLVLTLFFLILKIALPLPSFPLEVYLRQGASLEIALRTIKERPLFGSGPGTFIFDFSKYKSQDFNQGLLWGLRFDGASSKILTLLPTIGVLGVASFLILVGGLIIRGVRFIFAGRQGDFEFLWLALCCDAVLIAIISQTIGWFLYNSNLSLDFIFFIFASSLLVFTAKEKRVFQLGASPLINLSFSFIFIFCFIFSLGLLILSGQRFLAEANYVMGMKALNEGQRDEALKKLEKAARLNTKVDIYFTQLSQLYLNKLTEIANDRAISQEDKNNIISLLINNAINTAKIATDNSPHNVANWSIRGFVYQNFIGVIPEAEDWAIKAYDKAMELEPLNPYYPTQKGIVYMAKATVLDKEIPEKREEDLNKAKEEFEKAVNLKSDYAPARFQIAMVYKEKGQVSQGIATLEEAKKYSPNDVGLLFQIGVIYYQEGDYEKAKTNLESALKIFPDYANALYFLGLTYAKLGEKERALKQFQRVSELNPENNDIKQIISNLKEGKDPLFGIVQEVPPQAPVEEVPPEKIKK